MRRLIYLAVIIALALPGAAMAAPHRSSHKPHHPYTWSQVIDRSVVLGERWWHEAPSCHLRVEFGPLGKWLMGARPSDCLIRINPKYAGPTQLRYINQTPANGYGVDVWQVFCADIIDEVGSIEGHPFPEGYYFTSVYKFCGNHP